jgi:hypothetical protein
MKKVNKKLKKVTTTTEIRNKNHLKVSSLPLKKRRRKKKIYTYRRLSIRLFVMQILHH